MNFTERFSRVSTEPWLLLMPLSVFVTLAFIGFTEEALSPVVFSVLLFFVGYYCIKIDIREFQLYVVAFCLSIGYTIFLYYYYYQTLGAPYFNVPLSDDSSYERDALEYADQLGVFEYGKIAPTIVKHDHNSKGYVYFVALIAKLSNFMGGYHTLLPRIANALFHAFSGIFLYRLLKLYVSDLRLVFRLSLAFVLFPYILYLSGHIFRDTFVCFAFVFCLYKTLKPNKQILDWVLVAVVVLMLSQMRVFSSAILVGTIAVNVWSQTQNRWVRSGILGASGVAIIFAFLFLDSLSTRANLSLFDMLIALQEFYTNLRTGKDYSEGLAVTILQMDLLPAGIFVRTIYLAINPLPFLDLRLPIFINGLGTLLQVLLFVYAFMFTVKNFFKRKYVPLFFALWFILISVALTSFQLRHMVMYYPALFLLAALGYQEFKPKVALRKNIFFWAVFIALIGVWLYMHNKLI